MRVLALLGLLAAACGQRYEPTATDRAFTAARLQNLSDYVGFGGRFSIGATDRTLVMRGSDLCGEDFPELLPRESWRDVVDTGFVIFECSAVGGVEARVAVR